MSASDNIIRIPGAAGFETWRAGSKGVPTLEPDARGKKPDWIALPTKSLVSLPMRFHGVDASRREASTQLELEAAGMGAESAQPHLFETRVHDDEARDQHAWTCVQAAPLSKDALEGGIDAQFAPSVCFHPLEGGHAAIWREAGALTLAIPDSEGNPLHCQALTSQETDADAAAEIRCILAAAELAGAAPDISGITLRMTDEDAASTSSVRQDFTDALDVPVSISKLGLPIAPKSSWRLVPPTVVQSRVARRRRRTATLISMCALLVIAAGLGAFAAGLWKRQQSIKDESARLALLEPKLDSIRSAKDRWDHLGLALSPAQYPVELFHQLVELLPPEGIRLTLFEMSEDKLTIAGEASSVNHAISLREDLVASPAFKAWGFAEGFPSPSVLPDGRAQFQAEGKRPTLALGQ